MDKRALLFSCKIGNLSHVSNLVEEKDVDLNARDEWNGTPLYYACLCGHYEVVLYLLENGAQCDANTFDGERCLYGALTDEIRILLQNFKVISAVKRDKYSGFLRKTFEISEYSDMQFIIGNEKILIHRSILTCRSNYFQHLYNSIWKNRACIELTDISISPGIFKKLLQYLYMGQITINKNDLNIFMNLAKHFNMDSLIDEIKKVSSSRKKMSVLYVQPQPLPQHDFSKLFLSSLPKELQLEVTIEEPLFVDLHIKVDNYIFFCHKVFICGRCSYLKAIVTDYFSETSLCDDDSEIQIITLHDTDPKLFVKVLQYIYTDIVDLLPENVFDVLCLADMYILPGLKKLCGSFMQENLTVDNVISVIKLVRLYDLPRLEDQCTEFMAAHLEEIINQPEFINIIIEDASKVKNRQEIDSISVIDDIRYQIDKTEQVFNSSKKNLLIAKLLKQLTLEA